MATVLAMRINIIVVCFMFLLGMISSWLDFGTLVWMIQAEIQHELSDCPCKARRKMGLDNLKAHPVEGLTQAQVRQVFGEPEAIRLMERDNRSASYPDVEEIWTYGKHFILLHFEHNKCARAFPYTSVWH